MWPFSRISPKTRAWSVAFIMAAKLLTANPAIAETPKEKQAWEQVEKAKVAYNSEKSLSSAAALIMALQNLIDVLEKDIQKLPKGSKERKEKEAQLEKLKAIQLSLMKEYAKMNEEQRGKLKAEVFVAVMGSAEIKNDIFGEVNGKKIIFTVKELKDLQAYLRGINNMGLRVQIANKKIDEMLEAKEKKAK